jgi:uncharacterized protein YwqG
MGLKDWLLRRGKPPAASSEPEPLARIEVAIAATRTPFVRVAVADADEPLLPTASKLGGVPYIPEGGVPPDDEPFAFIAQINFADLVLEPFPRSGLVQFWVADDDVYGLFRDEPQSGFRCIYHPELDRPQQRDLRLRTVAGPLSPDRVLLGRRLTFHADTCVVSPEDYRWAAFLARNKLADCPIPDAVYNRYDASGHRIGGYCAFSQRDPRTPDDPKLSLLQLDSDGHVLWGDAGIAHWFIREADLRARDFSRVEYYWDCT